MPIYYVSDAVAEHHIGDDDSLTRAEKVTLYSSKEALEEAEPETKMHEDYKPRRVSIAVLPD